ncbi:leucine-rich repeat-containing protein 14-like isoform X1 [Antechinus flavipes]|uniref:leucine-rich repeat-containing protein 14-like isoform X1 n=1 Tax=Antechinus flavipes TaxID=38775 RepID=UPI002235A009|nr:leucine-rich repeat-containing protein 14-like isoform X1 [Antechinus flavipes]
MYSLRYLSAWQLVQNEEDTCKIRESLPPGLYGILFKVAFRYKKSKLLQELVKNWPYPQLKVQMLLQKCHRCPKTSKKCSDCQWTFPYNETSKNTFDDIIMGVISYIKERINDGSKTLPSRKLQQLDMTGLLSKNFLWNRKLMRLWASSISRAKICALQQKLHDSENQERSQAPQTSTFPVELRVDFLVDLEVSFISEEFLMAVLQDNINSLLHLTCRDFYVERHTVRDAAKFLVPLDPLVLRRIDLSNGQMRLMDIGWFMSQITIFQNMKSLKFPEFNEFMEHSLKAQLDIFVTESNKLKHLTEITFHNICLSDHLEYLLGGLQCSLKSLELSYCSLTNKDLTYLARSQHSIHLIKLNLSGNTIDQIEPLLELLKAASHSLVWLNMAMCGITDSKFYAALPSLSRCSRLSYLGLYGNHMTSTSVLTFLRQYQHKLPYLKAVAIPIFIDCCSNLPEFNPFPRSLESYINASKFNAVLQEMEELPRAEQESPIDYTLNCNFPVIDYFDFQ